MKKYKRYCVALNDKENEKFNQVKIKGFGIKKIFMYGLDTVEETQGDGINKSGIMKNIEETE